MNDSNTTPAAAWLANLLTRQRKAFAADMQPPIAVRLDRLERLRGMTESHRQGWIDAISADFRGRAAQETIVADLLGVLADIAHTKRHLKSWMATRTMPTRLMFRPGWNQLMRQPLGVVGVISPWNYPYLLAVAPVIGAIAAGNRVMIKPSELTPRFSDLLAKVVGEHFAAEELAVATGGPEIGRAFSELPFDHLLFTGSTAVGRIVAQAAARNLTPATLELGGKSPAILDASADLDVAVPRLIFGKLFNAGQTCIAPDYVLLHENHAAKFEAAVRATVEKLYPTFANNPDYTSIISDRHFARLSALLDDAKAKGARVVELGMPEEAPASNRRVMPPALVFDADDTMRLMQEEIFGPILPVKTFGKIDDALAYINAHDRPLSLYWFGSDMSVRDRVLRETISGGVTINDCLLHISQLDSPFGGVGASGIGAYHGEFGFLTFSKEKPIFHQSKFAGSGRLRPPYGNRFAKMERMLRWLM